MIDPTTNHNQQPHSNSTPSHVGEAKGHSKTYVFDAAYPPESTQVCGYSMVGFLCLYDDLKTDGT